MPFMRLAVCWEWDKATTSSCRLPAQMSDSYFISTYPQVFHQKHSGHLPIQPNILLSSNVWNVSFVASRSTVVRILIKYISERTNVRNELMEWNIFLCLFSYVPFMRWYVKDYERKYPWPAVHDLRVILEFELILYMHCLFQIFVRRINLVGGSGITSTANFSSQERQERAMRGEILLCFCFPRTACYNPFYSSLNFYQVWEVNTYKKVGSTNLPMVASLHISNNSQKIHT